MADNKEMSNTMEINSILEEARTRTYPPREKPARHARPYDLSGDPSRRTTVEPVGQSTAGDDYVFVEENGTVGNGYAGSSGSSSARRSPRGSKPKKKAGKPMVIAIVAAGVLLLAGLGGIIAWRLSAQDSASSGVAATESVIAQYPANTVVSGVNIGGMDYAKAKAALAPVEKKLADAISVEVTADEKKITLTKDDFKYSFNTDEILRAAQDTAAADSTVSLEIKMTVDESSFPAAAEKVAEQVNAEAKDAAVTAFNPDQQNMFTFQKEQNGLKLKNDELVKQFKSLFSGGKTSGTIQAPVEEQKAAITQEYLSKNIKKLSSFATYSTNTANAMSNQALSLSSCNGSIIDPGETWSFNACTGDSNLESNGYLPAGVIINGRHEIGIGGGICQSSTTIYNAGLLSGMTVVERECHYYPSSYVAYGRDATIDYGNIDLKLKNPFKYQLFLKCWMTGTELNAEIYGLEADDFDEIRISTSDPSYFATGYTVTAARTYYKDGKTVRSEELPSSTYYFSAPDESSGSSSQSPTESSTNAPATEPDDPSSGSQDPVPTDPGTDDPGTDDPGTDDPGTDDPGTDDPGTDDPGTDDPGTDDPGAGDPGTDDPGAGDTDTVDPDTGETP